MRSRLCSTRWSSRPTPGSSCAAPSWSARSCKRRSTQGRGQPIFPSSRNKLTRADCRSSPCNKAHDVGPAWHRLLSGQSGERWQAVRRLGKCPLAEAKRDRPVASDAAVPRRSKMKALADETPLAGSITPRITLFLGDYVRRLTDNPGCVGYVLPGADLYGYDACRRLQGKQPRLPAARSLGRALPRPRSVDE